MGLSTFAFLHPLDAAEVGRFQRALPEVEFLPVSRKLASSDTLSRLH